MSAEDRHRLALAAADKETAAFELDHAELNLQEAITVALRHGEAPKVIAEVTDLEPEEVLQLAGAAEEPALIPLDEIVPPGLQNLEPDAVPDAG